MKAETIEKRPKETLAAGMQEFKQEMHLKLMRDRVEFLNSFKQAAQEASETAVLLETKEDALFLFKEVEIIMDVHEEDAEDILDEKVDELRSLTAKAGMERDVLEYYMLNGLNYVRSSRAIANAEDAGELEDIWNGAEALKKVEENTGLGLGNLVKMHYDFSRERAQELCGEKEVLDVLSFTSLMGSIDGIVRGAGRTGDPELDFTVMNEEQVTRVMEEDSHEFVEKAVEKDYAEYHDAVESGDQETAFKMLERMYAYAHSPKEVVEGFMELGLDGDQLVNACRASEAFKNPLRAVAGFENAVENGYDAEYPLAAITVTVGYPSFAKKVLDMLDKNGHSHKTAYQVATSIKELRLKHEKEALESQLSFIKNEGNRSKAAKLLSHLCVSGAEQRKAAVDYFLGAENRFFDLSDENQERVQKLEENSLTKEQKRELAGSVLDYPKTLGKVREEVYEKVDWALGEAKRLMMPEAFTHYAIIALASHGTESVKTLRELGLNKFYSLLSANALEQHGAEYIKRLKSEGFSDFQILEKYHSNATRKGVVYYGTREEAAKEFSAKVIELAEGLGVPGKFFYRACEVVNDKCREGEDLAYYEKIKKALSEVPGDTVNEALATIQNWGIEEVEMVLPALSYERKFRLPLLTAAMVEEEGFKQTLEKASEAINESGSPDANGVFMKNQALISRLRNTEGVDLSLMKRVAEAIPKRLYKEDLKALGSEVDELCLQVFESYSIGEKKFISETELVDRVETELNSEYIQFLEGIVGEEESQRIREPRGSAKFIKELKKKALRASPGKEKEIKDSDPRPLVNGLKKKLKSIDKRIYSDGLDRLVENAGTAVKRTEYEKEFGMSFFEADFKVIPHIGSPGQFYLIAYPTEKEMKLLIEAGKKPEMGHIEGAIAYARVSVVGDTLIVTNLQSDVFTEGNVETAVRKKYNDWAKVMLLGVEELAKEKGYSNVLVTTPRYQLSKWSALNPETAYAIYSKPQPPLGYGLAITESIQVDNGLGKLFWEKKEQGFRTVLSEISSGIGRPAPVYEKLIQARKTRSKKKN